MFIQPRNLVKAALAVVAAEMVDPEENGYIAKAGDTGAWSEGVRYFICHPERIAAMGTRSFEKAKLSFSVEKIADEYLEDFRALVRAA